MFFMRHGQSTFNVIMDETGHDPQINDPPLTELGRQQVTKSAERFKRNVDLIVASPYIRAIETAHVLASVVDAPILIDPLVGEQRLYSCDVGSPVCDLQSRWQTLDFSKVGQGPWWLPFPESRESLAARVRAFKDDWDHHEAAARIMVISHCYFIHAITGAWADNAEIVEERI